MDYSKLPYPISHYHELVPDEIKLEFELEHLQLSNNDSFTHNAFFSNRRATIAKSLVRIKKLEVDTIVYSLKYLKTVDLASGDAGRDHWIFLKYKGENHLALACNEHLRALHQVGPQNQQFVRMAKTHGFPLLATACKCDEMSKKPGMGPLTPIGRYFLTPMREMMARLRNELKEPVNLASYDYEIEEQWVLQAPAPPDEGKVGDDITVAEVSSLSSITSISSVTSVASSLEAYQDYARATELVARRRAFMLLSWEQFTAALREYRRVRALVPVPNEFEHVD